MITQATFEKIQNICCFVDTLDEDVENVIFPKLFVLHNPSKQGFYIDEEDNVILSVSECIEPKHKTKVPRSCHCICPHWAYSHRTNEFTTYILGEEL